MKLPAKITNTSNRPVKEAVAYVSLVDVTKGQQAPVDLEDWSAHRAVTVPSRAPRQSKIRGALVFGGADVRGPQTRSLRLASW